jgi:hypothetical protein
VKPFTLGEVVEKESLVWAGRGVEIFSDGSRLLFSFLLETLTVCDIDTSLKIFAPEILIVELLQSMESFSRGALAV